MLWESVLAALESLGSGVTQLTLPHLLMIGIGCALLYLGIYRGIEPLLFVPIGFGAILVNIPLAALMEEGGFLRTLYDMGIITELFPILIFIGIGAMTDFGPLLENPKILLLGAAGQFGIFLTLLLALALGYTQLESLAIGIIGACDGPTAIYVDVELRAAPAGLGLRRGVFLHVAGADHPAAHHAVPDHGSRAKDHDAERPQDRLAEHSNPLPHSGHAVHRGDRADRSAADGLADAREPHEGIRSG